MPYKLLISSTLVNISTSKVKMSSWAVVIYASKLSILVYSSDNVAYKLLISLVWDDVNSFKACISSSFYVTLILFAETYSSKSVWRTIVSFISVISAFILVISSFINKISLSIN